jgi:small subunit ribosomal protein S13
MARLAGVDLPREKRMEIALTYIYGIGKTHAKETLAATGVSPDLRAKDLTDEDLLKLRDYIDQHFRVEGDLRRDAAARWRSAATRGCGTAAGSRCADSAPRPTRARARARARPSRARRRLADPSTSGAPSQLPVRAGARSRLVLTLHTSGH